MLPVSVSVRAATTNVSGFACHVHHRQPQPLITHHMLIMLLTLTLMKFAPTSVATACHTKADRQQLSQLTTANAPSELRVDRLDSPDQSWSPTLTLP